MDNLTRFILKVFFTVLVAAVFAIIILTPFVELTR